MTSYLANSNTFNNNQNPLYPASGSSSNTNQSSYIIPGSPNSGNTNPSSTSYTASNNAIDAYTSAIDFYNSNTPLYNLTDMTSQTANNGYFTNSNQNSSYSSNYNSNTSPEPEVTPFATSEIAILEGDPHIGDPDDGDFDDWDDEIQEEGLFEIVHHGLDDSSVANDFDLISTFETVNGTDRPVTATTQSQLRLGTDRIIINADGTVLVNDAAIDEDNVSLSGGELIIDGQRISINTNESHAFNLSFETQRVFNGLEHMNLSVSTKEGGLTSEATGVLGRLFDENSDVESLEGVDLDTFRRTGLSVAPSQINPTSPVAGPISNPNRGLIGPAQSSFEQSQLNTNTNPWQPGNWRTNLYQNVFRSINQWFSNTRPPAINLNFNNFWGGNFFNSGQGGGNWFNPFR